MYVERAPGSRVELGFNSLHVNQYDATTHCMKVGDVVERGQRVGLIKFGSRVDVLMPADADLKVAKGTRVKGGSTVLAVLPLAVETSSPRSRAVGA